MGIINLHENENLISEITGSRPLAAVPFAGRYRLIDFTLSNMVNSGVQNVGIVLSTKSRAVMDHIRSGKDWDLARKKDGVCFLPPASSSDYKDSCDISTLYKNLDFLQNSSQKYVLVSGSNLVYNMNYDKVLRFHQNTGAEITMIYTDKNEDDFLKGTVIRTADDGKVCDIALNNSYPGINKLYLGVMLLRKDLLVEIISDCQSRGGCDLLLDGIIRNMQRYNIFGFQYSGYVSMINSVAEYYKASMNLLEQENWQQLFIKDSLIYTKVKDEAPVKYKESANVQKSLVANGCVVEGTVENSILFRGVNVAKGACIKNSIIMQRCDIEKDVNLENVICDKNTIITAGHILKGAPNYPIVIEKGKVI